MSLKTQLSDLADNFANAVLAAIRGASIEDLVSESTGKAAGGGDTASGPEVEGLARPDQGRHDLGQPRARQTDRSPPPANAEQLAKALAEIHALPQTEARQGAAVRGNPRHAQARQARESPRVLQLGAWSTRPSRARA